MNKQMNMEKEAFQRQISMTRCPGLRNAMN